MTMFKKNGGFTLVELIVVIAILAILAGVAVPAYSGYIEKANEAADLTTLTSIRTAAQGALATEGAIDEIVIETIKDKDGKSEGVIGLIKVHVAGDPKDTKDATTGKITKKNYIYLYGAEKTAANATAAAVYYENAELTKTNTDGKLKYVNKDFKLYMNDVAPAVLKANELGTTWYAVGDELDPSVSSDVTEYVAGWNEVTTAPANSN